MLSTFLPWWLGALLLSASALFYLFSTGRLLGVSGMLAAVVNVRRRRSREREDALFANNAALEAALAAATLDQFGPLPTGLPSPTPAPSAASLVAPGPLPWTASATFLVMLVAGGFLGSLLHGGFQLVADMGPTFAGVFKGLPAPLVLLAGGVFVGFGTRMAGGCTSGHGLNGCARLQKASLLNTALFLGTAVVLSLLLSRLS